MISRGNVVHEAGEYKVYEVIETFVNNKTKVQGYHVVGPLSDRFYLHDLDSAVKEAEAMSANLQAI